ncbi:MAG: hypothetical protein SH857_13670 [Chitinophagales bacterium]|nr:hypothetical protein [Chitinophagales bacterium]
MMEEKGFIEIKFDGRVSTGKLTPMEVDIAEIKEVMTDLENFLFPTRTEKTERPLIAYQLEKGSAKHKFFLPITSVILFNGLIGEIGGRESTDFLDYKRAEIIEKFQRKAKEKSFEITFSSSLKDSKELKITKNTNYYKPQTDWINTEFDLYGEIYQEGGITPNLHIVTKEYGKLTISATKEKLMEGEKKLYKFYGVRAKGKQNLADGSISDLSLLEFIEYNPVFNKDELNILIKRAAPNLSTIKNVDTWLAQIRGGANG